MLLPTVVTSRSGRRVHRREQRRRTRSYPDGVFDAEVIGAFLLKGLHVRAKDISRFAKRLDNGSINFGF